MISATSRFAAVFIIGAVLIGASFYFAFSNFNNRPLRTEVDDQPQQKVTTETYDGEYLSFQYSSEYAVNARVSPADKRVYLIDVQRVGQNSAEVLPMRIQVLPKQTKIACDSLGGSAGTPLPVGLSKVQPCLIPGMYGGNGMGLRLEMPRESVSVIFFADRYDEYTEMVNALLSTVTWKQ